MLANDTEPDNEPLTAVSVGPGGAKSFEFHADGSFTYAPYPGYSGPDSFEYEAVEPSGLTARAVVCIFVVPGDAAPTAEDDFATTHQTLPVSVEVLANDRDRQGPLSIRRLGAALATHPRTSKLGSLVGNGNLRSATGLRRHVIRFLVPELPARPACAIRPSSRCTCSPGNQPPVAVDDSATTDEDVPVVIDVLANDARPG